LNDIYIHIILDESGSMSRNAQQTANGLNKFISDQKEFQDGTAIVSLTKFNTQSGVAIKGTTIHSFPTITLFNHNVINPNAWEHNVGSVYRPGGGTALNDAAVKAIRQTENDLLKESGNPKVMVVIITDGEENSSAEFTYSQVAKLISQKEQQGWLFVFLGADQDAWANARQYNVNQVVNYKGVNTQDVYNSVSHSTTLFRGGQIASAAFGETTQNHLDANVSETPSK